MGKLEELGEQTSILKASGLAAIGNLRVRYCLLNILKASGFAEIGSPPVSYCCLLDIAKTSFVDSSQFFHIFSII